MPENNRVLHNSFIKAMSFHRKASANADVSDIGFRDVRDQVDISVTSDFEDGECKYETDDEG